MSPSPKPGGPSSVALPPPGHQLLVVALPPALVLLLDVEVLALELGDVPARQDLLHNGLLPLLARQPVVHAVGSTGNNGADLAVLGNKVLARVLLEELLAHGGHVAHPQSLQVALQLGREVGTGHVEPSGPKRVGILFPVSEPKTHQAMRQTIASEALSQRNYNLKEIIVVPVRIP